MRTIQPSLERSGTKCYYCGQVFEENEEVIIFERGVGTISPKSGRIFVMPYEDDKKFFHPHCFMVWLQES